MPASQPARISHGKSVSRSLEWWICLSAISRCELMFSRILNAIHSSIHEVYPCQDRGIQNPSPFSVQSLDFLTNHPPLILGNNISRRLFLCGLASDGLSIRRWLFSKLKSAYPLPVGFLFSVPAAFSAFCSSPSHNILSTLGLT